MKSPRPQHSGSEDQFSCALIMRRLKNAHTRNTNKCFFFPNALVLLLGCGGVCPGKNSIKGTQHERTRFHDHQTAIFMNLESFRNHASHKNVALQKILGDSVVACHISLHNKGLHLHAEAAIWTQVDVHMQP